MLRSLALVAIAGTLVLASCGDDEEEDASGDVTAADLNGMGFASTSVEGYDLVEGSVVTLSFEGDTIGANAGCNSFSGSFAVADGTLDVGDDLASTMMACSEELMSQDDWLSSFLTDDPAILLDGDTLTLSGGDVIVTLTAAQG